MEQPTIKSLEQGMADAGLELATFGMGCFWGPDARFGSIPGTIRTRTGYAGGTASAPSYRQMADHTETLQVEFDSGLVSFEEIIREFWWNHYPNRDAYKGRQYISLLFWHNEEQREVIDRLKAERERDLGEPVETEIRPFESFTEAEARHQKYYLKRYPNVLQQLSGLFPDDASIARSTFAARLNGFVKGYGSRNQLQEELETWPIPDVQKLMLQQTLKQLKW